jgi:hypothetical protein
MAAELRIQNVYGDFLRSFKLFLDRVTKHSLNKIEWNYGAKPLEYYYMMNGHESFEYPIALVDIQDIQPVDGVGPIARNAGMNINRSNHHQSIAYNDTNGEEISIDKRWVNLMFNVTINTEDVTSLLNFHDLFITTVPTNFMFYDYKYYAYIEVTPLVLSWDFVNDDIDNVFMRPDATFRYTAAQHYNQAPEPHFHMEERDRTAGRDMDVIREGERYFSQVTFEPILKLQSIQKQTDKESQKHSLTLSFEAQIEIPNVMWRTLTGTIEHIEIVIDTSHPAGLAQEYPILTDMEENKLRNKNIQRGIILLPEDFVFPDENDPDAGPPYLEVKSDIDLVNFTSSLWAVEDVTEAASNRFFIPLGHAIIERIEDTNGEFISLRFYFSEMEWFRSFNFETGFNFMKIILFNKV